MAIRRIGRTLGVLAVVALAAAAALASPDPASAQTQTPYESLRALGNGSPYADDLYTKVGWSYSGEAGWRQTVNTYSNANKNVIYKQLSAAQRAARILPPFSTFVARASLAGTAAYVGWKIWQQWNGGQRDIDVWVDSDSLGNNSLFNPCAAPPNVNCPPAMGNGPVSGWSSNSTTLPGSNCFTTTTGVAFLSSNKCEVGAAWVVAFSTGAGQGGCHTSVTGISPPCFELHLGPVGYSSISDARVNASACTNTTQNLHYTACWWNWSDADSAGLLDTYYGNSSQAGWNSQWPRQLGFAVEQTRNGILASVPGAVGVVSATNGSVRRVHVLISAANLQSGAIITDEDAVGGTTTQTYNYPVPAPYTGPGSMGTATDTQAILDHFDSDCGHSFINWVLEPGTYSFDPDNCGTWTDVQTFPLLQPLVNETYNTYIARLRAAGWLGTATSTEATGAEINTQMGPEGVARVQIGTNTYLPQAWPTTIPHWNVNVAITFKYNPESTPEAPGGGQPPPQTGGGTGVPVPPVGPLGDWCPACPPVDFDPLTEADYGDSFPFGVIVWCSDFLGTLTTTADAPVFDFDVEFVDENYVVDLDVMDAYMATIRTILSWCIWIGGVWYFGARLLGFRETGDPGASVDDAW